MAHIPLHDLAFVFGILGNIVSFGVYLAPLPTFWNIYKKKSTQGFQSIPYAVALFSAMLLMYYAFVKENDGTMIITINTIGLAIEGFYLTVYMIYAPKKAKMYTAKLLGLFNVTFFALIVITTMIFARGVDHHRILSRGGDREKVVGWICAVFSVSVFAAPLSVMRMVIRTKSVEFMPFWLSFSLTLCAVMWFFYGFLIKDFYIALPNILGFAFGILQMILYIIYKDSKKEMMLKQNDQIKQFQQELAVDMKLGNMEMINGNDGTGQNNMAPQVVEIIVDEMVDDTINGDNNTNGENKEGATKHQIIVTSDKGNENKEGCIVKVDDKVANHVLPSGGSSV